MKLLPKLICLFIVFYVKNFHAQTSTFSNTTVAACDTWNSGGAFGVFTRNISVSGLPTGGLTSGGTVLRQINLQLGNSSCTGNLSSYQLRLTNPSGTNYTFSTQLATTTASIWVNMKFRGDAALERLKDYTTTVQNSYFPHNIGYYKTETTGGLATFNDGSNPNGTWVFSISETTVSEVSFEKIELVFGPAITVVDYTSTTSNDDCSGAICIDGLNVVRGTNNGFSSPDANYPGNTVNSCSWNGANNNSAWYSFYASGSSAYLTISGLMNTSSSGSSDMQPIILTAPSSCSAPTVVPTGGCPDDASINNTSYITSNGGGVSTAANVYVNGITDNCEFNLSGLTTNQKYYLYIDGNGGAASSFYIEMVSGAVNCSIILSPEFLSFDARVVQKRVELKWDVANDESSQYTVQRSIDGIIWDNIEVFNTNLISKNSFLVYDQNPLNGISYYRVQKNGQDGKLSFSDLRVVDFVSDKSFGIYPNPASDFLFINGLKEESNNITIYDLKGSVVKAIQLTNGDNKLAIDFLRQGVYFVKIMDSKNTETYKLLKF